VPARTSIPLPLAVELASPESQCFIALEKANHVRRARAELKRQIACRERDVADVLLDPPTEIQTMRVAELLGSQRSWGTVRTLKALQSASVSERKELRRLTDRQVRALLGTLRPCDLSRPRAALGSGRS
jgi:hypothetical protein